MVARNASSHTQENRSPTASLWASEVLTLAVLAQWPRWRSERDFWRFADVHLRGYFPNLLSHGQLNRRIRALEPELRALQQDLARTLTDGSEVYHVLDTTLIPAIVRVRASRKGLFAGQATFAASPRLNGSTLQGSALGHSRRGNCCLRAGRGQL